MLTAILFMIVCVGLTMYFWGWLAGVLVAFGNKQYIFGVLSFIFNPITLVYCFSNWDKGSYAGKLMLGGVVMSLFGGISLLLKVGAL